MTTKARTPAAPGADALAEAKAERNWLLVKLDPRQNDPAKLDKKPVDPQSLHVVPKDDAAKLTFEEAKAALDVANQGSGQAPDPHHPRYCLGYLPREGSALVGIYIDGCIGADGAPEPWARELIGTPPETYVEHSPSGRGLRVLAARAEGDAEQPTGEKHGVGIIATGKKFFTVTGDRLPEAPKTAQEARSARERAQEWRNGGSEGETTGATPEAPPAASQAHSGEPQGKWRGIPPHRRAAALRDALMRLPYDGDDDWTKISAAVKSAGPEIGEGAARAIWDEWCDQIGGDQTQNDKRWHSFNPNRQGGATVATIFERAFRDHGWRSAKWVFDPLPQGELTGTTGGSAARAPLEFTPASDFHNEPVPEPE